MENLFPSFGVNIVPPISYPLVEDEEVVTKQIEVEGQTRLVPVVQKVRSELEGLRYSDFSIQVLTATDQIKNLRPAKQLALSPLASLDMLDAYSGLLVEDADLDIAQQKLAAVAEAEKQAAAEAEKQAAAEAEKQAAAQ